MDIKDIVAVIAALTALVASMTGLFISIAKIGALRHHINSRMDQLLEIQAQTSHAQGMKDESDRLGMVQRNRDDGARALLERQALLPYTATKELTSDQKESTSDMVGRLDVEHRGEREGA